MLSSTYSRAGIGGRFEDDEVLMSVICIGCGSAEFFGGVEWISRLRSSKSASAIPNIAVAKPSMGVTKPNIVMAGRYIKGRGRKGN